MPSCPTPPRFRLELRAQPLLVALYATPLQAMSSAHASTIRPSSPYCFTAASSPRRQAVLSHRSPPMQVKQNTAVARTRPASPARAKTHTQLQHMRHRPSLSPASCADIPPVPKTQSTPCNSNHCGPGHKRGRLQRSTRSTPSSLRRSTAPATNLLPQASAPTAGLQSSAERWRWDSLRHSHPAVLGASSVVIAAFQESP